MAHSHTTLREAKFRETESRRGWGAGAREGGCWGLGRCSWGLGEGELGARGGGVRELVFSRDRGSVWEDEKVQAVDSGGSCTTK